MPYNSGYRRSYRKTPRRRLTTIALRDSAVVNSDGYSRLAHHVGDMLVKHARKEGTRFFNKVRHGNKSGYPGLRGRPGARGRPKGSKNKPKHIKSAENLIKAKLDNKGNLRGGSTKKDHRHETLRNRQGNRANMGRGNDGISHGTIYTHSRVPKWKYKRMHAYKHKVWQTVLISKTGDYDPSTNALVTIKGRIANSNNLLNTFRYPIPAPQANSDNTVQCILFTPYIANYSGVHSTYAQKIASSGTDLDHIKSHPLDVIQRKAPTERHESTPKIEATEGTDLKYQTENSDGSDVTAATVVNAVNLANVHKWYDQLVKQINVNLTFMSSRVFDCKISISVIRSIKPREPYTLSMDDKQQFMNNLGSKGIDYNKFKIEWHHSFILPGLKGTKIQKYHVNKTLKTNFLMTNAFADNTTDKDMDDSNLALLGSGINRRTNEVADGYMSSQFWVLIKYRKVQQPNVFRYEQVIDARQNSADGHNTTASVSLPVLTEQGLNVPDNDGYTIQTSDGTPLAGDFTDETKCSFYYQGKLSYCVGYREETEGIPSVISLDPSSTNYKKTQSLNIDPTIVTQQHGIYTRSPCHQTMHKDTSV